VLSLKQMPLNTQIILGSTVCYHFLLKASQR